MGKGSQQRPRQVSAETWRQSWERTFRFQSDKPRNDAMRLLAQALSRESEEWRMLTEAAGVRFPKRRRLEAAYVEAANDRVFMDEMRTLNGV